MWDLGENETPSMPLRNTSTVVEGFLSASIRSVRDRIARGLLAKIPKLPLIRSIVKDLSISTRFTCRDWPGVCTFRFEIKRDPAHSAHGDPMFWVEANGGLHAAPASTEQ